MNQKKENKISVSTENLIKAFRELEEFLAEPVVSNRDRAGVIKAFEFTFELFWKTFQKIADIQGIDAKSPRESLKAGFQLGYIVNSEEESWLNMLKDRNLMSHLYHEEISQEIFDRIETKYLLLFKKTLAKIQSS